MRRYDPRIMVATAFVASLGSVAPALSQDAGGPPQVLVPTLTVQGVDDRVGERVSSEVRDLLDDLTTHGVVSEKDLKASMARYKLEELDEITARQLAQQMNAQIVMWGVVERGGAGLQADVRFIDVRTGDQLEVEDATGADHDALARAIVSEFQQKAEGLRLAIQCGSQVLAQQYEPALASCDQALALVPRSTTALAGRAAALLRLERWADASTTYGQLLEIDPANQDALLGAGLAASRAGQADAAVGFYNRYLEVNGSDVAARSALVGQIVPTGDFVSAFRVLEPVVAENATNAELQQTFVAVATAAGQQVQEKQGADAARPYYQAALTAYQGLASANAVTAAAARQAIAVNIALGNTDAALALARQATTQFATDASVWSQYAQALSDAGQHAEAADALSRVVSIDENFDGAYVRRGSELLRAGRRQEALADLERAVSRGNAGAVAAVLYGMGAQAYQANRFEEASDLLDIASRHAEGDVKSKTQFLLGVALYRQAEAIAKANTSMRAAEAERALPLFQRAVAALQASTEPQAAGVLSAAQQYVTNQQAVIAAGRR